ncbi:hypothetical protein D9M68_867880 [compost metagenome]
MARYPFDRDIARQCLAGEGVAALVRPAVADLGAFQVAGEPAANAGGMPRLTAHAIPKHELHVLPLLGHVVALHDLDGDCR